jgi:hypothetical protein
VTLLLTIGTNNITIGLPNWCPMIDSVTRSKHPL